MLRQAGARFAYLFGSRATGSYRPESDIDIAAYFGGQYIEVDDAIVVDRLGDLSVLEEFVSEVARYVTKGNEAPGLGAGQA